MSQHGHDNIGRYRPTVQRELDAAGICPSSSGRNVDVRIGDLALRVGVPPATLRAWERRYGLLSPERSPGGHREYTDADLARVRHAMSLVESGLSISAAAAHVHEHDRDRDRERGPHDAEPYTTGLWRAAERFDEAATRHVLTEADTLLGREALLDDVLVPTLRRLGRGWRANPRNVAREHFTTAIVRSYLLQHLADRVDRRGPLALAAAPAGESHDLGVVMAGVAISAAGWHPVVLGAQTPWASVESLLAELEPAVLLIGAQQRSPAARWLATWKPPASCTVVFGGMGFSSEDLVRVPRGLVHHGAYAELPSLLRDAVAQGTRRTRRRT